MVHFSKFIKFPNRFFNKLEDLAISFARRKAQFHCLYGSEKLNIDFLQFGEDTVIRHLNEEITVENVDFLSIFLEDLETILMEQRPKFRIFSINFSDPEDHKNQEFRKNYLDPIEFRIYKNLEKILKSGQKLICETVTLRTHSIANAIMVLPYFDMQAITTVYLMDLDDGITVDVIRLLSLEMWKTENFHGEGISLYIKVEEITLEMLENIRKVFISCPFFSIWLLLCKNHFEKSIFPESFGGFQPLSNYPTVKKSEVWPIPNGKNRFFGYRFVGNSVNFTSFSFEEKAEKAGVSDDLRKLSIKPIDNILSLKVFENNLIMEILLKHLGLFEIQILRKVSAGIRKCVDTVKPDTYIHEIEISPDFRSIGYDIKLSAEYHFQPDNFQSILYIENGPNQAIIKTKNGRFQGKQYFSEENFQSIFFKDLELQLKFQKGEIQKITFNFEYKIYKKFWTPDFSKLYERNLKFLGELKNSIGPKKFLKIQTLWMVSTRQEELKKILEFIFPKILVFNFVDDTSKEEENDEIRQIDFLEDRKFLKLNEISKMKAWMDSEEIYCTSYRIITEIQNFEIAHFKEGEILVENVSSEDVAYLKEKFLQNQRLEKFKICFENCQINGEIYKLLGRPFKITEHFSIWYFRITNSEFSLHLKFVVSKSVTFSLVPLENVPENAFV
ncbi:hypothetical protein L3Y34_009807 [Caenorhabditis briggsae]|uniref:DUF38 domain-containing protein n=1 Tax=Caenorhabditis briggsae TaxID=6238 RepID=A0AAE9A9M9_CAEBR|nr:hypothetical protein L3Y34_009807 [Caenorhabditis briggsae]